MKCKNCAKQYFCKLVNNPSITNQDCKDFLSWIYTKDYGKVKHINNKEKA